MRRHAYALAFTAAVAFLGVCIPARAQTMVTATVPFGALAVAGKLAVPTAKPTMDIREDSDMVANVWLSYDLSALHVFYKVIDSSPLKNSGSNWLMLFKTGDSCDLQIGLDPQAPSVRDAPVPGDIRVEFVPLAKGPMVVLVRYKTAPGAKLPEPTENAVNGWSYTSPTGQFTVDRIEQLPTVKVRTALTADGYTLAADLPWPLLAGHPMGAPAPGTRTTGDAGVLFSDPDGQQTVDRVYWSNHDTAIVADVPTEAKITPSKWGILVFGAPPAK